MSPIKYRFSDNQEYIVSSSDELWRKVQSENSISLSKSYSEFLQGRASFLKNFYNMNLPDNATANAITLGFMKANLITVVE